MKQTKSPKVVGFLALVILTAPLAPALAGSAAKAIQGDWKLQVDIDGQQFPSILSISKNTDGTLRGEWLSFWGISELREIKYESRQLSFAMTIKLNEGDTDTKFAGSLKKGNLSGVFTNDLGEYPAQGKRVRRIPIVAGTWKTKLKMGDREFEADLIIRTDTQGKLSADWKSGYGEHEITNVQFKPGRLTFDRKSRIQDRQWDSTFEGTLKGHVLSGTIKSERGEIALEGKRLGTPIIGQWVLDVEMESRTSRQLLRVFPDLSARYGAISIAKVNLDDKDVTFKTTLTFGYESIDISFAGQLKGRKLVGEISSPMGTARVTGQRRRPTPAGKQNAEARNAAR
ncbi:MAG: hypothetical protein ACYSWO_02630 [Planctomycetota bacterium]|jgi:hypothetical protein